jgi:hypothetical protein
MDYKRVIVEEKVYKNDKLIYELDCHSGLIE